MCLYHHSLRKTGLITKLQYRKLDANEKGLEKEFKLTWWNNRGWRYERDEDSLREGLKKGWGSCHTPKFSQPILILSDPCFQIYLHSPPNIHMEIIHFDSFTSLVQKVHDFNWYVLTLEELRIWSRDLLVLIHYLWYKISYKFLWTRVSCCVHLWDKVLGTSLENGLLCCSWLVCQIQFLKIDLCLNSSGTSYLRWIMIHLGTSLEKKRRRNGTRWHTS